MLVPVKAEEKKQVKEVKNKLYCGHRSKSKDAPHLQQLYNVVLGLRGKVLVTKGATGVASVRSC